MKRLFFVLVFSAISFFSFCKDYSRQAHILKATISAFDRILENQETLRSFNLDAERERAVAIRLLRKQQSLIALACSDIDRLNGTPDAQVKKSFEQVVLIVCSIVTYLLKNVTYKKFNGSFFSSCFQALDFCQEVHIKNLLLWAEGDSSQHIDGKVVSMLKNTLLQLKQTLQHLKTIYLK